MNVFLLLNGLEVDAPESEVVDVMVRVAAGRMSRATLAEWLGSVAVPYAG